MGGVHASNLKYIDVLFFYGVGILDTKSLIKFKKSNITMRRSTLQLQMRWSIVAPF